MARTYSVMHRVALSSTTAPTAKTAVCKLVTVQGMTAARIATGINDAAFCSAAVARKSTPRQNRCW